MSQESNEKVAGGPLGKVVGKMKEAAGVVVDDDLLAREGRLQASQSDAEIEAQERRAAAEAKQERADLEAEKLDTDAERARLSIEVEEASRRDQAQAERDEAAAAERIANDIEREGDRA